MPSESNKNHHTYRILCNVPILLLVVVASLDSADKNLLASSFPALERTLNLDIKTLGYFSLFADLSYALSVPFWGYLVHRHGLRKIYILLSVACASWGFATIGIAVVGSSIVGQAIMRSLNGWMLGSILPLSQTLLVEMVPPAMRGRGFGVMAVSEKLAGTLATTSVVYFEEDWEIPYYGLGVISVVISWLVYRNLDPSRRPYLKQQDSDSHSHAKLTLRQIVERIARLPAFRCLVAQGVFGGIPWSMMSFQLLLLDWRGFTKDQLICIQFTSGLAGTLGVGLEAYWEIMLRLGMKTAMIVVMVMVVVGSILSKVELRSHLYPNGNDRGHGHGHGRGRFNPIQGRVAIAFISIIGGIPSYGMFLYSTDYTTALLFVNLFHVLASWTQTAAIRPICADLTRNPSERAQIVAMWIVLEKMSAAIFGAPLVGYLTSNILQSSKDDSVGIVLVDNEMRAGVLARQLFILSSLFWVICAFFWVLIARFVHGAGSASLSLEPNISIQEEMLCSIKENKNNPNHETEIEMEGLLIARAPKKAP
eukprot:CAMPEP_0194126506 /NCGR_PEP_ID=MMETSP0150-20130528/60023_1 /TAXON_ID=122233 /ORGANISM="Chaetoceros debilis, Strain MM31A-1" /LENGTH=535 /DNA_ID=CAMNT_0038820367 /DNA_START=111 /DNA_END=1719 /DNA_ORIENTATION=+